MLLMGYVSMLYSNNAEKERRGIDRRRNELEYTRLEDHLPGERMVNRAIWGTDYNPKDVAFGY
jgi:hypothetical protein